jgi:hypothetical protein
MVIGDAFGLVGHDFERKRRRRQLVHEARRNRKVLLLRCAAGDGSGMRSA